MKNILLCLIVCLGFLSILAQEQTESTNYTKEVFQNTDSTYGYKVFRNGKAMINQPSIPAVPGNKGFEKIQQAENMAELVIYKLKNNIMPPTVSVAEVDSIKAIVK
jgi:hypothetical protein